MTSASATAAVAAAKPNRIVVREGFIRRMEVQGTSPVGLSSAYVCTVFTVPVIILLSYYPRHSTNH